MNTTEVIIIDGLPPSSNHGYQSTAKGGKVRVYKKAEVKAWQDMVAWQVQAQRQQPHQDWTGRAIVLYVTIYDPKRSVDLSNAVKYTEDAVARTLGFNDKMVDDIPLHRDREEKRGPGVMIQVMEVRE